MNPADTRVSGGAHPQGDLSLTGFAWDRLDRCWYDLLATVTDQHPDRDAVVGRDGPISYRRFLAMVASLTRALQEADSPGPVGILLPADATYAAALLACAAAGRVGVALDPDHPPERTVQIIQAARVSILMTDQETRSWSELPVVPVPRNLATTADPAAVHRLVPSADVDGPAIVVPTSGSTGRPKLIVLSQRAMSYRGLTIAAISGCTPHDAIYPGVASPGSYPGLTALIGKVLSGTTMHLIDPRREGLLGTLKRIDQGRISIIRAAPALWRTIADHPDARRALRHVRLARIAGEASTQADIAFLRDVLPVGCQFLNFYGSTESPNLGWFVTPSDVAIDPVRTPAGRALPGVEASIVGEEGEARPAGEVGELVLRSRYHALGELVDGKLVPDRFRMAQDGDQSMRLYATGDLARMDANGVIVILGRADRQIKINGQRIAPEEIEQALRGLPDIVDAAVIVRHSDAGMSLQAFVTTGKDRASIDTNALRGELRQVLPTHMVPARITRIEAFARLPTGKIDYAALRDRP